MSKSEIAVILPSEGDGWEVWSTSKGVSKHVRSIKGALTKSSGLPGDCVAFSICRVATLPLLVPSSDPEIYQGAAQLELENAGLLQDVEGYKGWDCLPVEMHTDQAFISAVYLLEEELNVENDLRHYSFDLSARFYLPRLDGDCIAMWRERNTWVMAFYRKNVPFLVESLGNDLSQLGMSVNLLLTQLEVKGILFHPEQVKLWSESEYQEDIAEQLLSVELKLVAEEKPAPSMPIGSLELQPSEASEWQKRVRSMMRLRVVCTAVAALYLIGAAFLMWRSMQIEERVTELKEEIAEYAPDWESNTAHYAAWEEIDQLVQPNWPLEMYKECVMSFPVGQSIRLTSIELHQSFIEMKGKADLNVLKGIQPRLRNSDAFGDLVWEFPQETKENKTPLWEFSYSAKMEGVY